MTTMRARASTFLSRWGGPNKSQYATAEPPSSVPPQQQSQTSFIPPPIRKPLPIEARPESYLPQPESQTSFTPLVRKPLPVEARPASCSSFCRNRSDSLPPPRHDRSDSRHLSRPASMVQIYQPPVVAVARDTLPELQPIFSFLNSHSKKLYHQGYFLKLHDLDFRGRPSIDRSWSMFFAQLVGVVLCLWDATELDNAGEDGEVLPTFINLSDASIKMIKTLQLSEENQDLQNVLSVSTAASNRYLLHFDSFYSLSQWTAGIRLALFEHVTLQESYTGSLIAGKGKSLNNIRTILERTRFKYEDWVRVRFGAGEPWRRCWCVVVPPDEKEHAKIMKQWKNRSIYNRSTPIVKGEMHFYDTKKVTKKTIPIATIKDVYSAYAVYPQSKTLMDQSTLVKVQGQIVIHPSPASTTEGFVFVLPESHPAVLGFEIMLRFLIPVFDTFGLYGRPTRLIADPSNTRCLMFAMPTDRRYGYLELFDVLSLIQTDGSQSWTEERWRKEMKLMTIQRMNTTRKKRSVDMSVDIRCHMQGLGTLSKDTSKGSGGSCAVSV